MWNITCCYAIARTYSSDVQVILPVSHVQPSTQKCFAGRLDKHTCIIMHRAAFGSDPLLISAYVDRWQMKMIINACIWVHVWLSLDQSVACESLSLLAANQERLWKFNEIFNEWNWSAFFSKSQIKVEILKRILMDFVRQMRFYQNAPAQQ